MRIDCLEIENFRNIAQMQFYPEPGVNVICGNNAQGKTNLLEAVWLFSGARSFRGAKESEYIRFEREQASLNLSFYTQEREQSASIRYGKENKAVFLNEIKQDRIGTLSGVFCTVVFSPDHLSLIKDGPETRRRMIDISLCQAYPKYARISNNYDKLIRQRNRLLKDMQHHAYLVDTLDIWDHHLLEYGAYITQIRARYTEKLGEYASEIYAGISKNREKMEVGYLPSFGGDTAGFQKNDYQQALKAAIQKSRSEDIRLGSTTIGPHRDDIQVLVDGVAARSFGSQGQQRSCVLALKLAECRILEDRCLEPPVVLLDDVISELDRQRSSYLLNHISGRQVIITCCDRKAFSKIKEGRIFTIKNGEFV